MRRWIIALAGASVAAIASPASATFTQGQYAQAAAAVQKMSEINLFVFGNASLNSDVEGKAWIGGTASGSVPVGMGGVQSYSANPNVATLTVGGDVGGLHIKNGIGVSNVVANVGGNSNGAYFDGTRGTLNAGGSISGLNGTGTGNANVAGLKSQIASQTSTYKSDFQQLAAILGSYSANTTFVSSDQNNLHFTTSSSSNLLVANINGSTLQNGTLFLPTLASGQILVVNVSGNGLSMGANINNLGPNNPDNQQIIWNFLGTGTMQFNGWDGSILAAGATVANNSQLNGSVVASLFQGGGEVHLGTFNGSTTTLLPAYAASSSSAPEPAAWAMMILGFGSIGGVIRRDRRRGGRIFI